MLTGGNIALKNGATKKEFIEVVQNLLQFDCDFSGGNGKDYLLEEAQGYNSNNEFLATTYDTVEEVVAEFMRLNSNYYSEYDLTIIECCEKKYYILTCVCED